MKTKTTMLALLLMAATTMQSVGQDGTIINGLEWANTNVSTTGSFADQPDMYTEYYWWNGNTAWAAANDYLYYGDWLDAGEPNWAANTCPTGWRLPTQTEFESLINSGRTWADANTKGNALAGMFFGANHATATIGNMQGCIFLPAVGSRNNLDGSISEGSGIYWSSTTNGANHTTGLLFSSTYVNPVAVDKITAAHTLRCVQATTGSGSGTLIDGVMWANANVAQPRNFATDPDMHTEFYQWNSNKAWAATGSVDLDEWKAATQQEWTVNPCPEGWRVPTTTEYESLASSGYTWSDAGSPKGNEVHGVFFGENHAVATMTNMQGCIFLPFLSYREGATGMAYYFPYFGAYWTTTQNDEYLEDGYGFHFPLYDDPVYNVAIVTVGKTNGLPIRCVRGNTLPNIEGTQWAETNLIAENTWALRPDEHTNFFQWGINTNYPATGSNLPAGTTWNTTPSTATKWTNDPCPSNWRLPTRAELQELTNSGGTFVWADNPSTLWRGNAVSGMFFGERHIDCSLPDDMADCIFFPASGSRNYSDGWLNAQNYMGIYWSSESYGSTRGYMMNLSGMASLNSTEKNSGCNIRCVLDYTPPFNNTRSMSSLTLARANSKSATFMPSSVLDTCNAMSGTIEDSTSRAALSNSAAATPAMTNTRSLVHNAELAAAKLYPNPVINGELTIDNGVLGIGVVTVVDSQGAVVRTQDFGSQTTGTLRLHGLQGTYFIRIGKSTQSIVVTK